jgi:hypothetical protein
MGEGWEPLVRTQDISREQRFFHLTQTTGVGRSNNNFGVMANVQHFSKSPKCCLNENEIIHGVIPYLEDLLMLSLL